MTFVSTANCVVFQGGTPVFSDIDPKTLLVDPALIEEKLTLKTKAIIAVDYAGQPCDYDALRNISEKYEIYLVADACHALGASYKGKMVGSLADLTVFSFHAVKHITTGEGGMIVTDNKELDSRLRLFRNHGIATNFRQREKQGSWIYEMVDLGYNYRITELQCALGISQLKKLPKWIACRQSIAQRYEKAFAELPEIIPQTLNKGVSHGYHLYSVQLDLDKLKCTRAEIYSKLRHEGIGVNVHYIPVHFQPFYHKRFGLNKGHCRVTEAAYERMITLPLFPTMSEDEVDTVITAVKKVIENCCAANDVQ
jgi:perosamine synthetase